MEIELTPEHYDVIICTPGRSYERLYMRSLLKTIKELERVGISWMYQSEYSSSVATAREYTAMGDVNNPNWSTKVANGVSYGKMFWIDSDMQWEPVDFIKLYESDKDIISGLYMLEEAGRVAIGLDNGAGLPLKVNRITYLLQDDPSEIFGCGFGFVAIRSGVFEKMERPWFYIRDLDVPAPELNGETITVSVAEDYSFCMNARDAGFKVWVDPLVKLGHLKAHTLTV